MVLKMSNQQYKTIVLLLLAGLLIILEHGHLTIPDALFLLFISWGWDRKVSHNDSRSQ